MTWFRNRIPKNKPGIEIIKTSAGSQEAGLRSHAIGKSHQWPMSVLWLLQYGKNEGGFVISRDHIRSSIAHRWQVKTYIAMLAKHICQAFWLCTYERLSMAYPSMATSMAHLHMQVMTSVMSLQRRWCGWQSTSMCAVLPHGLVMSLLDTMQRVGDSPTHLWW